jgi:hypothetical protein
MRTFVVRLQDDRTPDGEPTALRGVADDIASGRRSAFSSGAELLTVLAAPPRTETDTEDSDANL